MSFRWRHKFAVAFRGIAIGMRGQASFRVHLFAAAAVIAMAAVLRMHPWQWAVLLLCIAVVLTAELFNSALESLSRAITAEHNDHVGQALDVAAGAVLTAAIAAAAVGTIVLLNRVSEMAGRWGQ